MSESREDVTRLLGDVRAGKAGAVEQLTPLVYAELHRLAGAHMRRENPGHTLQTTALVHEAYVRLVDAELTWQDRVHFYAVAATTMRRILVDHARARRREKRGGGAEQVELDETRIAGEERDWEVLDLDRALDKLGAISPRQMKAVELRFFGGLSNEEVARALDVSVTTARADLRIAKAWLRREMSGG